MVAYFYVSSLPIYVWIKMAYLSWTRKQLLPTFGAERRVYRVLEGVIECIYYESKYGVILSLCTLEGGNSSQGNKGLRQASQNATRWSRHHASLRHDDRRSHKQLSKRNRLTTTYQFQWLTNFEIQLLIAILLPRSITSPLWESHYPKLCTHAICCWNCESSLGRLHSHSY